MYGISDVDCCVGDTVDHGLDGMADIALQTCHEADHVEACIQHTVYNNNSNNSDNNITDHRAETNVPKVKHVKDTFI